MCCKHRPGYGSILALNPSQPTDNKSRLKFLRRQNTFIGVFVNYMISKFDLFVDSNWSGVNICSQRITPVLPAYPVEIPGEPG